ncbi:hypothetical protein [Jiangella alkaliphila]|uniref:Uncharacterized protein n=1 Tax=Jiangella alkaliphila TaxID=419479 RepID=A0A1H2L2G4_9ACTN|nr:hypothetical protein [Jiangella alkaliphila]SDU74771.1 hypothetical protein SAMN04488563_4812 [Jiangella alkaliphila]
MFLALAHRATGAAEANAQQLLSLDAATVSYLMEAAWSHGGPGLLTGVGGPKIAAPPPAPVGITLAGARLSRVWTPVWDHLIYAYMIENTRVYEIMGRVIAEYTQGERLGILRTDAAYQWLRTTEELFYKDASPLQPYNLVSRVRPDIAATRRNAYYRMFGMDLNHGRDGAPAYPYIKPPVANREFVTTFEEFLRQVWRAIENARNFLAGNPTDFAAIQDLADRLENMLTARRGGGPDRPNLSREEFLAVALFAWLHLTLAFDTAIVQELAAAGPSPEERLRQIGERVGLPAHGRSHSYFLLAPRVSTLLVAIERGDFNDPTGARTLAAPGPVRDLVSEIIHHWSQVSGRSLKAMPVASDAAMPVAVSGGTMPGPAPSAVAAPAASNGKVAAELS